MAFILEASFKQKDFIRDLLKKAKSDYANLTNEQIDELYQTQYKIDIKTIGKDTASRLITQLKTMIPPNSGPATEAQKDYIRKLVASCDLYMATRKFTGQELDEVIKLRYNMDMTTLSAADATSSIERLKRSRGDLLNGVVR